MKRQRRKLTTLRMDPAIIELAKAILAADYEYYKQLSGYSKPSWIRVMEEATVNLAKEFGLQQTKEGPSLPDKRAFTQDKRG